MTSPRIPPDQCLYCQEECNRKKMCRCCIKLKKYLPEPYCHCKGGPKLGKRIDWAKPRCGKCHLFVASKE